MFQVREKRCLSLMHILSGIFRYCKLDKLFFRKCVPCILFSTSERDIDLGRSRLVGLFHWIEMEQRIFNTSKNDSVAGCANNSEQMIVCF